MSEEIKRIETLMEKHGIAVFDYREGDIEISLRKGGSFEAAAPATARETMDAPTFGRFHLVHPATGAPAPALPRRVKAGDVIAYLAVGPILRPVTAGRGAVLRRALRAEGSVVGFGEPLFEI